MSDLQDQIETIKLYLSRGIPPGSFIHAVLANDLMGAMSCTDGTSHLYLFQVCSYLYNHAPRVAIGSYEAVNAWIKHNGASGWDAPDEMVKRLRARIEGRQ